jgi:hypothetical protein
MSPAAAGAAATVVAGATVALGGAAVAAGAGFSPQADVTAAARTSSGRTGRFMSFLSLEGGVSQHIPRQGRVFGMSVRAAAHHQVEVAGLMPCRAAVRQHLARDGGARMAAADVTLRRA